MTNKQKKRLFKIIGILLAASVGIGCVLMALQENIQLYYTPSELGNASLKAQQTIRMGGLVTPDSIQRATESLRVQFNVTDGVKTVPVFYEGVLPDLFREGQGVIVKGSYRQGKGFYATEVLTKHDERYVPKELVSILKEPS